MDPDPANVAGEAVTVAGPPVDVAASQGQALVNGGVSATSGVVSEDESFSGLSEHGDDGSEHSSVDIGTVAALAAAYPAHPVFHPSHPDSGPWSQNPGPAVSISSSCIAQLPLSQRGARAVLSAGVPLEVASEIARYSGMQERGSLLRVSHAFYWGSAPWLYRELTVQCPSVVTCAKKYPSYHVLTCLLRPLSSGSGRNRTQENLESIQVLSYTSTNSCSDFVALPLLADVLRFCTSLRELRVHSAPQTANILLDTLRHHGVVDARPVSLFQVVVEDMRNRTLLMPKLRSLHVSDTVIGVALAQKRPINTFVVDRPLSDGDLPLLFPVANVGPGGNVTRLSLCVLGGHEALEVVLLAVGRGFPALEHLALRTLALQVIRLVEVGVALLQNRSVVLIGTLQSTFRVLALQPGVLPVLRSVAYNHGGLWGRYSRRAVRWRVRLFELGQKRPLFSSFTCGTSRWDRVGDGWTFTAQMNPNQPEWLRLKDQL